MTLHPIEDTRLLSPPSFLVQARKAARASGVQRACATGKQRAASCLLVERSLVVKRSAVTLSLFSALYTLVFRVVLGSEQTASAFAVLQLSSRRNSCCVA